MNERPIPPLALEDPDSVEMLRVWIAGKRLHTSMKVGMYKASTNIQEERAWGRILADVARHVADALHEAHGSDRSEVLAAIADGFTRQLERPETEVSGGFLRRH